MKLSDRLLVAVALEAALLAPRRRELVPVALTLAAMATGAAVIDAQVPAPLARAIFFAWPAPAAALACSAFGVGSPRRVLLGFALAGAALAAAREVPAVAALPEEWRARAWRLAYEAGRVAGVAVSVRAFRRPETPPQLAAAALGASAAWDLVGWLAAGDPWRSWSALELLAGVTWVALGAILVLCTSETSYRVRGSR